MSMPYDFAQWTGPRDPDRSNATNEYVWILRAEGETWRMIASRLGVTKQRARQRFADFSRRTRRATRRCRFRVITE